MGLVGFGKNFYRLVGIGSKILGWVGFQKNGSTSNSALNLHYASCSAVSCNCTTDGIKLLPYRPLWGHSISNNLKWLLGNCDLKQLLMTTILLILFRKSMANGTSHLYATNNNLQRFCYTGKTYFFHHWTVLWLAMHKTVTIRPALTINWREY